MRVIRSGLTFLAAAYATAVHADFRDARLQFDGTDDIAVIASQPGLSPTAAITVEAWIRPATLASTTNQDRVVSKTASYELTVSTGDTGCGFGTSGHVQWRATIGGTDARVCGGTLTTGAWTHIAGTYAAGSFALYLNGARVANASRTGTLAVNANAVTIGNRGQLDRAFDGGIDEVRIWSRALTQAELQANMASELGGSGTNLAAEYRFAEGTGQVIADATPNGHDGTRGQSAAAESSDPAWVAASANSAPTVDAGPDQTLTLPTQSVFLNGTVTDDGLPASTLNVRWSQVSGPATASIADPANEDTQVTFPSAGTYVLQLAASDGELTTTDTVRVQVQSQASSLASIEVLPEFVTVAPGRSQQFTATGYDATGNPVAITPAWSTSSGTITANGLYTAPTLPGTYVVQASAAGRTDTAGARVHAGAALYPGTSWQTATPAAEGMNVTLLDQARDYALTGGGSGFIVRHGRRVYAWGTITARFELKSATKSIGSAVLGLAVRDGRLSVADGAQMHLTSFGTPPESNASTGWLPDITLLQLATHSSGFEKTGGFGALLSQPGTRWRYSDGATNWLADVLTQSYGQDLNTLFFNRVMTPIGIPRTRLTWRSNAYRPTTLNGIARREFGSGISSDVESLARFGYLFLRRGEWAGQRILDESFVDFVRRPVPSVRGLPVVDTTNYPNASNRYGVLWWSNADGQLTDVPRDAYWAWGLGEELIIVIPSLDLVVARLGGQWSPNSGAKPSVLAPFLGPISRSVN